MRKKTTARALLSLTIMALAALMVMPATEGQAKRYKLNCKGPYQLVAGNYIASPPCQDRYIARVARQYGYKVSAKDLANRPSLKISICVNLSHDTRIRNHCPYSHNGSGGGL